jgi:site-specific DNA-cytosine methylase
MIDLCTGTGAFTYAFESTQKVKVVFANDMEPSHEILTDGFPFQPFSIAGKQS